MTLPRILSTLASLAIVLAVLPGCEPKAGQESQAASSADAIAKADTMKTDKEKTDYLVGQAEAFLSAKKYDDALKTAQHVIANLDKENAKAKAVVDKAKAAAAGAAKKAVEGAAGALKKTTEGSEGSTTK